MGWIGPITHRQFRVWIEFYHDEWNRPSRSDFYLMQLAAEFIRPYLKQGKKVSLKDFKLQFGEEEKKPLSPETKKAMVEMTKAQWLGWVGGARVVNERGEEVGWLGPAKQEEEKGEEIKGNPLRPTTKRKEVRD